MTHSTGIAAYGTLISRSLHIGFYSVVVLNAGGLFLVLLAAFDTVPSVFSPMWLRMPLLIYVVGVLFAFMGLFWTHLLSVSLLAQSVAGRLGRGHWLPMLCATLSYGLSLLAFVAGCWLSVALAGVASSHATTSYELPKNHPPVVPRYE